MTARKKREKTAKRQKIMLSATLFLFMMACGGIGGYLIGRIDKEMFHTGGFSAMLFGIAAILFAIGAAWLFHMYLHEVGHLLFGLATGYRFCSIRFGSLMLSKTEEGLRFMKFTLAGTGGQCLMLPPKEDAQGNYPTGLYNWGGCLMNLLLSALCFVGYFSISPESVLATCLLLCALIGIGCAFLNGIPFSSLSNDGYNAIILRKSKGARKAFRLQLLMNYEMMQGKRLSDFPEEWFELPSEWHECPAGQSEPPKERPASWGGFRMDNTLVTSAAVVRFSYLMEQRRLKEAEQLGLFILEEAEVLAGIHETIVKAELLFLRILRQEDGQETKAAYEKDKKQFAMQKAMPSMQRIFYAYYLCVEKDEKKAAQAKEQFEKIAKRYPNPAEIEEERALFALVEEAAGRMG